LHIFTTEQLDNYQIFISFFFKLPKRKKAIIIASGAQRRGRRNVPTSTIHQEEEILLEDGDDKVDEDDIAAEEEADAEDPTLIDVGRVIHDNAVVRTIRGQAIQIMKDQGVIIDAGEEKMALQLFPRVSYPLLHTQK
jgi:hypothetical protein